MPHLRPKERVFRIGAAAPAKILRCPNCPARLTSGFGSVSSVWIVEVEALTVVSKKAPGDNRTLALRFMPDTEQSFVRQEVREERRKGRRKPRKLERDRRVASWAAPSARELETQTLTTRNRLPPYETPRKRSRHRFASLQTKSEKRFMRANFF